MNKAILTISVGNNKPFVKNTLSVGENAVIPPFTRLIIKLKLNIVAALNKETVYTPPFVLDLVFNESRILHEEFEIHVRDKREKRTADFYDRILNDVEGKLRNPQTQSADLPQSFL